jgi:hypothetical protein
MDITIVGAALAMGLVGSVHCIGMCGPLAGVLCAPRAAPGASRATVGIFTHLGRVSTYASMGAASGATGEAVLALAPIQSVQLIARCLAAAAILGVGLYLAGLWPSPRAGSAIGRFWSRATAVLTAPSSGSPLSAYLRGAVWGLLPCGLVFGALVLSLSTRSAAWGALVMLAFGLGTIPALSAVGVLSELLKLQSRSKRLRRGLGIVLMASASVQLALAFVGSDVSPIPQHERPCCAGHH